MCFMLYYLMCSLVLCPVLVSRVQQQSVIPSVGH